MNLQESLMLFKQWHRRRRDLAREFDDVQKALTEKLKALGYSPGMPGYGLHNCHLPRPQIVMTKEIEWRVELGIEEKTAACATLERAIEVARPFVQEIFDRTEERIATMRKML